MVSHSNGLRVHTILIVFDYLQATTINIFISAIYCLPPITHLKCYWLGLTFSWCDIIWRSNIVIIFYGKKKERERECLNGSPHWSHTFCKAGNIISTKTRSKSSTLSATIQTHLPFFHNLEIIQLYWYSPPRCSAGRRLVLVIRQIMHSLAPAAALYLCGRPMVRSCFRRSGCQMCLSCFSLL